MPKTRNPVRPIGREPTRPSILFVDNDVQDLQQIHGRVVLDGGGDLMGLTVRAIASTRQVQGGRSTLTRESSVSDDGAFEVLLPSATEIEVDVTFQVRSADGTLLYEARLPVPIRESLLELRVIGSSVSPADVEASPPRADRLHGRVIDGSSGQPVPRRGVVIWVQISAGADFLPILALQSDARGAFFASRPLEPFIAAHATVARYDESVPLRLDTSGRLPSQVLIVIDDKVSTEEADDCACAAPPTTLPSEEDFTAAPDSFVQDLGPGCVSFTRPHRSLHEKRYTHIVRTTEPRIKGLSLNGPVVPLDPGFLPGSTPVQTAPRSLHVETARSLAAHRFEMTEEVLATTLAQEHTALAEDSILPHLKRSDDRDRLDADNPIDWDNSPTFYQATTIAHGHLLEFKQAWKSAGYSMGSLLYSLPLAPGQKRQIAILEWSRSEQARRTEDVAVEEHLDTTLDRDRNVHETTKALLREEITGESSSKTSSFGGGTGAAGAFEIPNYPITVGATVGVSGGVGRSSSKSHQESSRSLSASASQHLRDHTSQAANAVRSQRSTVVQALDQSEHVEARTEVVANYNHCHSLTMEYFEVLRHLEVSHELVDVRECLFVPLLMTRFDAAKIMRWMVPLRRVLLNPRLAGAFDAVDRLQSGAYVGLPSHYEDLAVTSIVGTLRTRTSIERPRDVDRVFDHNAWSPLNSILPNSPAALFERYLSGASNRDEVFEQHVAPLLLGMLPRQLVGRINLRNGSTLEGNRCDVQVRSIGAGVTGAGWGVEIELKPQTPLRLGELDEVEVGLNHALRSLVRSHVDEFSFRYRSELGWRPLRATLRRASLGVGMFTSSFAEAISFMLGSEDKGRIDGADRRMARQLADHLDANIEYYHRAIWRQMDPARRYMLLDGFEAPHANGRSVASVVENRIVDIVGNCLVMPVIDGLRLDPTVPSDAAGEPIDLLNLYTCEPTPPLWISLPTPGVYAEAVMGACNSCEMKDDRRFWRWEESPVPDSPTAIDAVSLDSRRAEPGAMQPSAIAPPIVNIQNVPAAPDPVGVSAALGTLSQLGGFRDATGLNQNQINAAQALGGALDSAETYAQMATDLVKAKLGAIKEAQTQGSLSETDANAKIARTLDEFDVKSPPASSPPATLKDVAQTANETGATDITVKHSDGSSYELKRPAVDRERPPQPESDSTVPQKQVPAGTGTMVSIEVQLYIPSPAVAMTEPTTGVEMPVLPVGGLLPGYYYVKGDGHLSSPATWSSVTMAQDTRVRLSLNAVLGQSIAGMAMGTHTIGMQKFGLSDLYDVSAISVPAGMPPWWRDVLPSATPLLTRTLTASQSNLRVITLPLTLPPNATAGVRIRVEVNAQIPTLRLAPAINAVVFIDVFMLNHQMHAIVSGSHDSFPSWLVRVDGTLVYRFDAHDPIGLMPDALRDNEEDVFVTPSVVPLP